MMFDYVIGNPPYNTPRNESNNQSQDLYDLFILKAYKLANIVCLITPSRWFMKQSKKMNDLRKFMCNQAGLVELNCVDSNKFFNLDIKGGTSWFVGENGHKGDCLVNGINRNLKEINEMFGCLIWLDDIGMSILNKLKQCVNIQKNFKSQSYFKIKTNDKRFDTGDIKCRVSKAKGNYRNVPEVIHKECLKKWKVVFPAASGGKHSISYMPNNYITIEPPDVAVSESFIFFAYDTEQQAINMQNYFKTDLIKWLISLKKIKQHVTSYVFSLVPDVDSNEEWDNDKVNKYFNLTEEEIEMLKKWRNNNEIWLYYW